VPLWFEDDKSHLKVVQWKAPIAVVSGDSSNYPSAKINRLFKVDIG
jgi:hypothetical protein